MVCCLVYVEVCWLIIIVFFSPFGLSLRFFAGVCWIMSHLFYISALSSYYSFLILVLINCPVLLSQACDKPLLCIWSSWLLLFRFSWRFIFCSNRTYFAQHFYVHTLNTSWPTDQPSCYTRASVAVNLSLT
jgi:hypothetical protein